MVVPLATAFTRPPLLMVATDVLLLLHEPPATASVKAVVLPAHRLVMPLMVPAEALLTVTMAVADAKPQPLDTV